jgi:hypothetical protein
VLAVCERNSSGGFLVYELVVIMPNHYLSRGGRLLAAREQKILLDGNKSRIPYSEGSLSHKHNFLKFKHENVIKMKNKPDPALFITTFKSLK